MVPVHAGAGAGGAGESGGAAGAGNDAFDVISVTPLDGATSADRSAVLSVTFSEEPNPATINMQTWTVVEDGIPVSGTVSSDGATATFTPDKPLTLLAECSSTLSSEITDAVGDALAEPYTWSFQASDGQWTAMPSFITGAWLTALDVAIDDDSNVIVVTSYVQGASLSRVMAKRYVAASDMWGDPVFLDVEDGDALRPSVVMSGNGDAVAVWAQYDGERYNIWANRFLAELGEWGQAELLEVDDIDNADFPRLASDGQGNAIAVWQQFNDITPNIWVNRFLDETGEWEGPTLIDNYINGDAQFPTVAMNAQGDAMVAWLRFDGSRRHVWARRFSAGGWEAPLPIEDTPLSANGPQVVMDATGNAFVLWSQYDDAVEQTSLWVNRFEAGSGTWGEAVPIEVAGTMGRSIAVDPEGNAIVAWLQDHEGGVSRIWVRRFSAVSATWEEAEGIESDLQSTSLSPSVAIDDRGNALVTWSHADNEGVHSILVSRFVARSAEWGADTLLEEQAEHAEQPDVAINRYGVGVVAWLQQRTTSATDWNAFARLLR